MISEEIKNYIPEKYNKSNFSEEQNNIIERALTIFNDIAKDRETVTKQLKDEFVHNLLNPEISTSKMEKILEAEIALFTYTSTILKNPACRNNDTFEKLTDDLLDALDLLNDKEKNKTNDTIIKEINTDLSFDNFL